MTEPSFNGHQCPKCQNTLGNFYRRGVHYDHERMCSHCHHTWTPQEEYERYVAERLQVAKDDDSDHMM